MIICAHGYSGNARGFDDLARDLAKDARVICIDVAGRGESDWLRSSYQYHFGQFLSDINALIAHLLADGIESTIRGMKRFMEAVGGNIQAEHERRLIEADSFLRRSVPHR